MFKAHSKWSKEDLEWNLWSFSIIFRFLLHRKFPKKALSVLFRAVVTAVKKPLCTKTQFWNLRRKKKNIKKVWERNILLRIECVLLPRWVCGETMFQDLVTFLLYIMPQCSNQARDTKQNPFYLRRVTPATTKCLWNPQEEKMLWTCCFFIVSFEWT